MSSLAQGWAGSRLGKHAITRYPVGWSSGLSFSIARVRCGYPLKVRENRISRQRKCRHPGWRQGRPSRGGWWTRTGGDIVDWFGLAISWCVWCSHWINGDWISLELFKERMGPESRGRYYSMAVLVGRFAFLRSAVISLFLFFVPSLPDVDWPAKWTISPMWFRAIGQCPGEVAWQVTPKDSL